MSRKAKGRIHKKPVAIAPHDSRKNIPAYAAHDTPSVKSVPVGTGKINGDLGNETVIFRFDKVDLDNDCPWSMAHMSEKDHEELLRKLKEYEKETVGQLIAPSFSHFTVYHDFSKCPNSKAVNRLESQYPDSGDSIARFRLTGTKRLYGFLEGNQFHIVWWDSKHEIWPSHKKHT